MAAEFERENLADWDGKPMDGYWTHHDPAVRRLIAEAEARGAERALEGLDGLTLIAAERRRQIEVEGWTPEHDRQHGVTRLLRAAEAYRWNDSRLWPWDREWWKPKDHVSNLIRAGALYHAASDLGPLTYAASIHNIAAELDGIFDWLRDRADRIGAAS